MNWNWIFSMLQTMRCCEITIAITGTTIACKMHEKKPNLYFNVINFINDFKLLVRKLLAKFHFGWWLCFAFPFCTCTLLHSFRRYHIFGIYRTDIVSTITTDAIKVFILTEIDREHDEVLCVKKKAMLTGNEWI